MKSKNDITSHENVLEAMEQSCTESNCKGEEHPKGSHPVFPTRTLPSAERVKLAPPLGGNKADSLHAALPKQRKPVFNPFSSPMSNSRAQRLGAGAGTALGDSTACDSPSQHGQQTEKFMVQYVGCAVLGS